MTDVDVEAHGGGGVDEPPRRGPRRAGAGEVDFSPEGEQTLTTAPPTEPPPVLPPTPGRGTAAPGDQHRGDQHRGDQHHGDQHHGAPRPSSTDQATEHPHRDRHGREHPRVRAEIDPFDRPFLNPLTATIDMSGLRRRLEAEELGRIDFEPRLYGKPRDGGATESLPGSADIESTQVLRRPGRHRTPGQGVDVPQHREPHQYGSIGFDRPRLGHPEFEVVESDVTRELHYGLRDLAAEAAISGRRDDAERGIDQLTPTSAKSKAIWTLLDQVVSSGTNTLIGLIVARTVSTDEFGAFSVAFTLFALFIGLSRAGATTAMGIRYSAVTARVFHSAAASATGAAFSIGLAAGLLVVGIGTAVGGLVGESLVAIGILFPGLLLQDSWRYVFFARGRPSAAFTNDVLWAAVQLAAVFILISRDVNSASAMLLAWGAAGAVAALVGVAQAGVWPAPDRTKDWISDHRDIFGFTSLEFIVVQGSQQASLLLIGALASIQTIGALRGVQILLGPTTVLAVGIVSFAIPELSRRQDMTAGARLKAAYALSALVVSTGVVWGLMFLVLPDRVGEELLGDTWPAVNQILALTIVQQAGAASTIGAACVLYSLGKAKLTFRANLFLAPQLIVWPLVGLQLGDVTGVVIGYIVAFWAPLPYWLYLLRRAVREHAEATGEPRTAVELDNDGDTADRVGLPSSKRARRTDIVTTSEDD